MGRAEQKRSRGGQPLQKSSACVPKKARTECIGLMQGRTKGIVEPASLHSSRYLLNCPLHEDLPRNRNPNPCEHQRCQSRDCCGGNAFLQPKRFMNNVPSPAMSSKSRPSTARSIVARFESCGQETTR